MTQLRSSTFTRINRRYGAWRVLERIGTGGMGEVFRAENEEDGSEAALKFIGVGQIGDELNRKRFVREIRACSVLRHPAIIKILGAGEEDGDIYLAMDLLRGDNLAWTLEDKGALTLERAGAMAVDMLEALAYMHPRGFVHRDIKPSNIFLTDDRRHVLMDFGLVRVEGEGTLTMAGNVLGTPRYMSPEVMHGSIADRRGDLFQMGVVIYETLTREVPYQPVDHVKFARGDFSPRPLPARHWLDTLPASMDVFLANALAARPAERYARAEDMIEDLKRVLAGHEVERLTDGPRARTSGPQLPGALATRFPNADLLDEEPGLNRWFSNGAADDAPAVIKVLSARISADADRRRQMLEDLERLRTLKHPQLVTPRDHGVAGESVFVVENVPPGESLARTAQKPTTFEEIVLLGVALCDALAPLHACGRPHGFVDPRTVRVERRALAAITELEMLPLHQIGKLSEVKDSTLKFSSFTAPEQLDGHPPTAAADVYSVGVLLAGLLGKSAEGSVKQVLARATGAVLQRYPSVAAFKSALNALVGSGKRSAFRPALNPASTPLKRAPEPPKPFDPQATERWVVGVPGSDPALASGAQAALSSAAPPTEAPGAQPALPLEVPGPDVTQALGSGVQRALPKEPAAAPDSGVQSVLPPDIPAAAASGVQKRQRARASASGGQGTLKPRGPAALDAAPIAPTLVSSATSFPRAVAISAVGIATVAVALWLLFRPTGPTRAQLTPASVQVEARPTDASLAFQTQVAWAPGIEYGPPQGPFLLLRATGPARTDHRFRLNALAPGQTYRYRFVYPDGGRDGGGELKTLPVRVTRGRMAYSVVKLEQEFATEPAVRCRVELVPRGRTASPVPVLVEEQESGRHSLTARLMVPGEACSLRVLLVRSEGDPLPLAEWPVESFTERLDELTHQLAALDPKAIVEELVTLRNAGTPASQLAAKVAGRVAPTRPAVEAVVALAPSLAEEGVGLTEKLRLYALLTRLIYLDAGCDLLGVPCSTGALRSLPASFRPSPVPPPAQAEVVEVKLPRPGDPFVPKGSPLALLETDVPSGTVVKNAVSKKFTLKQVGTARRAAIFMPAQELNPQFAPELIFLVSVNQQVPLVFRFDVATARGAERPAGLTHTIDPRLLAEGSNEITVRLIQIPGLAAPMAGTHLSKLDVLTWRD